LNTTIPVVRLREEKFAKILCYPRPNPEEIERRIAQLKKLGVKQIQFTGEKQVDGLHILGKGFAGIVLLAVLKDGKRAVVKIRRVDAPKNALEKEKEMLKKANKIGVGPKLLENTQDMLLMQYIQGKHLPQWIQNTKNPERIRKTIKNLLHQCYELDKAGIDHGELSRAPKHIIVDGEGKPHIIDFEGASDRRKPRNLTAIAQYLFIRQPVAQALKEKLGEIQRQRLLQALRKYKREQNDANFKEVLKACHII